MADIAYIVDEKGQRTHVIVPLKTYETLLALQELLKSSPLAHDELYYLNFKQHQAYGYPQGLKSNPQFVLIKGSEVALTMAPSMPKRIVRLKEDLLNNQSLSLDVARNAFVLTRDIKCKSVSQAALLCSGMVINGMEAFKNKAGFSLRTSGYGRKKRIT